MLRCTPPTAPATRATPTTTPATADLFVCPFTVLIDTREQAPWSFQNIVIERRLWVIQRVYATLATGDYSIVGCEGRICIERKSAADLVGSVTSGNARFRREHERMKSIVDAGGFACVVVEGCLSAICDELDAESGRRVTSESIMGAVASWPQRYSCPWFFAGDRRRAELLGFRILLKWWKESECER